MFTLQLIEACAQLGKGVDCSLQCAAPILGNGGESDRRKRAAAGGTDIMATAAVVYEGYYHHRAYTVHLPADYNHV